MKRSVEKHTHQFIQLETKTNKTAQIAASDPFWMVNWCWTIKQKQKKKVQYWNGKRMWRGYPCDFK